MFAVNKGFDLDEPWLEFKNLLVRQLAFCVGSPNILAHTPPEMLLKHAFQFHNNAVWSNHFQNYHSIQQNHEKY